MSSTRSAAATANAAGNPAAIRVPYGRTVHGEAEIAAVVEVLRTSTQMGTHVRRMEESVAALFAKSHGIMVNSGSSANYLAVELLGLPPGAEVITPALTFATTVAPIVKNGLVPAFVDVEPNTFNIDVEQIEEMVGPNTKAMMVPSLIGNLPDWDRLAEIAAAHNLLVVEDSADTLGATLRGTSTGTRSHISTTSFYGSHVINCGGNGGMASGIPHLAAPCHPDERPADAAVLARRDLDRDGHVDRRKCAFRTVVRASNSHFRVERGCGCDDCRGWTDHDNCRRSTEAARLFDRSVVDPARGLRSRGTSCSALPVGRGRPGILRHQGGCVRRLGRRPLVLPGSRGKGGDPKCRSQAGRWDVCPELGRLRLRGILFANPPELAGWHSSPDLT